MSLAPEEIARLRAAWDERASTQPPKTWVKPSRAEEDLDLLDFHSMRVLQNAGIMPVKDSGDRRLRLPPPPAVPDVSRSGNSWILFIPDVHRPSHSKDAWLLMVKVARNMRRRSPGKLKMVLLGDYLDAYCISSHAKDPNRSRKLEDEIRDGNDGLDELDSIGADEKYITLGNHCWRLARYLADKAPELYNMLCVEGLLGLPERGWRVTPYQETLKLGKLHITHDLGKAGATAHEDARRAYEGNAIIGHTHRSAISYQSNMDGTPHCAAMFGWLGDPKKIDYKHQAKATREWVHGVGIGLMEPDGVVHVSAVPFINGRAAVFGEVVS